MQTCHTFYVYDTDKDIESDFRMVQLLSDALAQDQHQSMGSHQGISGPHASEIYTSIIPGLLHQIILYPSFT